MANQESQLVKRNRGGFQVWQNVSGFYQVFRTPRTDGSEPVYVSTQLNRCDDWISDRIHWRIPV